MHGILDHIPRRRLANIDILQGEAHHITYATLQTFNISIRVHYDITLFYVINDGNAWSSLRIVEGNGRRLANID